ncbi:hypothetical protein BD410DRAFT_52443 [Rickenella mellea]|uniref:DUF6534 domain-containing protein n=1 Tax=Rickenella mellea TaxID=50990 RepID=A0A4R5XG05_9AGAM|nr:hypothetical protein BD410DRAFT_52443 [Rickenella mellea]
MVGPPITLDNTLGAALIGLVLATLLFGILTLQCYIYFTDYPEDRRIVKGFIGFLWFFNGAHVAIIAAGIYHYLIKNFTDPAALRKPNWAIILHVFLNSFIAWLVQLFFAWRVWGVSQRNKYLTAVIVALACLQFAFGTKSSAIGFDGNVSSFDTVGTPRVEFLMGMYFGNTLLCDLVITSSLCFILNKSRTGFKRTDSIINQLMLFSLSTGIVTSIFAVVNLVVFFTMPTNLVHLAVGFLLSKLYSNSLLVHLNIRDTIRHKISESRGVNVASTRRRSGAVISNMEKTEPVTIFMTRTSEVRTDDSPSLASSPKVRHI